MKRLVSSPRLSSASKARWQDLEPERDVLGHISGPALGGIEGDNAETVAVLARQKIANNGLAIGLGGIGLVVSNAVLPVGQIVRRLVHLSGDDFRLCRGANLGGHDVRVD
jgi:hypothetical protein